MGRPGSREEHGGPGVREPGEVDRYHRSHVEIRDFVLYAVENI